MADSPSKIGYLVHHVEQCFACLVVVERRMKAVRPEPTLGPEGIDGKRLQIWVLFDLGDEFGRRLIPPVYLTHRKVLGRLPGVESVPPDHLIEVYLLATG